MKTPFKSRVRVRGALLSALAFASLGPFGAFASRADALAQSSSQGRCYLLVFTEPNCPPCDRVKPVVDALIDRERVDAHYVDLAVPGGRECFERFRVRVTPTFLLVRSVGPNAVDELERWYGPNDVGWRIRRAFDDTRMLDPEGASRTSLTLQANEPNPTPIDPALPGSEIPEGEIPPSSRAAAQNDAPEASDESPKDGDGEKPSEPTPAAPEETAFPVGPDAPVVAPLAEAYREPVETASFPVAPDGTGDDSSGAETFDAQSENDVEVVPFERPSVPVSSGSGLIGGLLDRYRDGLPDEENAGDGGDSTDDDSGGCPGGVCPIPDSDADSESKRVGPIRGALNGAADKAIAEITSGAKAKIDLLEKDLRKKAADVEKSLREKIARALRLVVVFGSLCAGAFYWFVRLLGRVARGVLARLPKIRFETQGTSNDFDSAASSAGSSEESPLDSERTETQNRAQSQSQFQSQTKTQTNRRQKKG